MNMKDMNLKLNVYEGREIVKTYECNAFDVELATVEDAMHSLRFDKMVSGDAQEMVAAVVSCIDTVRPFLCDMFDGLTMEEARHTRTANIVEVFQGLFAWFTVSVDEALGDTKKK
jgi:hypothetical protein